MIASEREVSAVETIEYNGWFTLQWHITHRCNLRCTHCYQDDYTAFESADALFDVLGQYETLLRENRFKGFLNITGGEPLTHPELFRLLEEAKKRGVPRFTVYGARAFAREVWARRDVISYGFVTNNIMSPTGTMLQSKERFLSTLCDVFVNSLSEGEAPK